jgi:hypothetical protein
LAFRLDQNSPDRSHQAISCVRQIFEVIGCVVVFRSGECFVEALDRFGDSIVQIIQSAQESCLPRMNLLRGMPSEGRRLDNHNGSSFDSGKIGDHKRVVFYASEDQTDIEQPTSG